MAADGSIIIDTKVDTGGFDILGKNISGLPTILRKIGSAIGAAFAVGKLTNFAREAIKLGSNLSEVQNVVDVTFETLNENINSFAENALFVSGLSETMAKKYAGTFGAMANAFGFTEQEAYTLSTTLTTLSGDIASFYNITQDEAFTKLKSVFTGETETLKDLGVVMTQTALDAYAMEKGIGRTVAQMSEQEKVALRYRFVLDQLSDASGDFARTSGSWANQTRILSVQFDQLKATIGQGLINALTPVIQVINTILVGLQKIANAFKQFTALLFGNASDMIAGGVSSEALQEVAEGYGAAADGANDLADGTKAAAKEAKRALSPFDELNKLTKNESATGSAGGAGGIGGLGLLDNLGALTVDADIQDEISPKIQAIVDKVKELIEPLREISFEPFQVALESLGTSLQDLGSIVLDNLEWAWFNVLIPLSQWTIEEALPAYLESLAKGFEMISATMEPVGKGMQDILDKTKPLFDWLGDTATQILQNLGSYWEKLTAVFVEKGPEIRGILSGLADIFMMFWYTLEPILSVAREMVFSVFNDIANIVSMAISTLIDVLYGLVEFIAGVLSEDWGRAWNGLLEILTGIWDGVVALVDYIWQGLVDFFDQIIQSINNFVSEALGYLGGLFGIGKNSKTTEQTYSTNPTIAAYARTPEVPYLAKGAVLPANNPFLAVLGDQTNGRNLEAPEDLIRQIVREESGGGNAERVAQLLETLIAVVEGIEVGDEVIGKAAARYNRSTARARGY